jgi:hypothetical protein
MMISRVRAGSARSHTPGATRLRPYPSDSLAVTLKEGRNKSKSEL